MIKCQACGTESPENSQYCDECGSRLENKSKKIGSRLEKPRLQQLISEPQILQPINFSADGKFASVENLIKPTGLLTENSISGKKSVHAKLVIERGKSVGTEFLLTADESFLGRWDADNGIFPDVDLDKYDVDAKISRRHARIIYSRGTYQIEDLGSTNGTFINRGRRLIPGVAQLISAGDEIIVGKTFLRFYIE